MHVNARTVILSTLVMLLGLVPGMASAQFGGTVLDLDADDAVGASVVVSRLTFLSADQALLGTSELFADNLSSGGLQGVDSGRPLLLTQPDQLDDRVLAELTRLGVENVSILGGELAVEPAVADALIDAGFTVGRLAGQTRFETAVEIAEQITSDTVIIARATPDTDETQAFADSLAAGAWAAEEGWPVVLTQTSRLTDATADHLRDAGYTQAFIIGGQSAISVEAFRQIDDIVDDVTRVAGANRFATAVEIAERRGFTSSGATTPIVIDGQSLNAWVDGFTLAALAGRNNVPIVLGNSATEALPRETIDFLTGGTDTAFAQTEPGTLGGDIRAICGAFLPDSGDGDQCADVQTEVGAANREAFDGSTERFTVAVSPTTVIRGNAVGISVTGLAAETTITWTGCGTVGSQDVGAPADGRASISFSIPRNQPTGTCPLQVRITSDGAARYDQATTLTIIDPPVSGATGTARPELISAVITQTVLTANATTSRPQGTYVRFTFDSGSSVQNVNRFYVYTADHTRYVADVAVREGSGSTVEARFDTNGGASLALTENASQLALAAVGDDAVRDLAGLGNPAASAQIGSAQSTSSGNAGQTAAPDLTQVSGFRPSAVSTQTMVDFSFDEAAFVTSNGGAGFSLEMVDGSDVTCVAPTTTAPTGFGTAPGGSGEATISVQCPNTSGTSLAVNASNTSRGEVAANAVSDLTGDEFSGCTAACTGNSNAGQVAHVGNSGLTTGPDLTLVQFAPDSVAGADQVGFTFDENINAASVAATDGALFNIYTVNGDEVAGNAAVAPTVSGQIVTVTFADGVLANAVGGNVDAGTLTGATSGAANALEEEAVGNVTTVITPGQTAGAQLTGVQLQQVAGFDPTGVEFTFDEIVNTPVAASLAIFAADGTKYTASSCAVQAAPNANMVECTAFGTATPSQIGSAIVAAADSGAVQDSSSTASAPGSQAL